MQKQVPQNELSAEIREQKTPIDLESLTPIERIRLDTAVMALVEYLVTASAKTA